MDHIEIDVAENAERALRMVREAKEVTYDTETTGLDWRVHSPVGYVVGAPSRELHISPADVVYVPVRHGGGGNLLGGRPMTSATEGFQQHEFEVQLARAFDYRNQQPQLGRTVGHHMKFDVHMSHNAGINMGRKLACSQNMAAMADEYARKYGLEVTADRLGVTAKKAQPMYDHLAATFGGMATHKIMSRFWELSGTDPMAYDYATGDGVSTMEVYWKLDQQLREENMEVVRDLENDLIWTVFRMERRGIKVDMDEIEALRFATEGKISRLMGELPVGFNPRSPLQMRALMEEHGHTDWPLTDKGSPSFTERFLKTNEIGRTIIEIRQMSNLINSFINPLAERHIHKGRVHATLNQLKSDDKGTISGRFSCSDPNLQQVPKRNKELAKPFRRLFVVDGPEWVFWERDYSQCEPRLFAHYAQDENLLKGYNATPFRDAHQVVADLLDVERDPTAKRMNMGIFTGMQPKSFAGHMGWSVEKATVAHRKWFSEFPAIREFQDRAKARLKNKGFVYTLLGRRCRLEHPRFAYRGTSKVIQGGNADIVKYKLLQADRLCEDNGDIVQVNMTVHDSFNGQYQNTPEAKALFDRMVAEMEDVVSEPFNLSVPFLLEGTEGKNWSEATYGVDE